VLAEEFFFGLNSLRYDPRTPEQKVRGSNPLGRTILLGAQKRAVEAGRGMKTLKAHQQERVPATPPIAGAGGARTVHVRFRPHWRRDSHPPGHQRQTGEHESDADNPHEPEPVAGATLDPFRGCAWHWTREEPRQLGAEICLSRCTKPVSVARVSRPLPVCRKRENDSVDLRDRGGIGCPQANGSCGGPGECAPDEAYADGVPTVALPHSITLFLSN